MTQENIQDFMSQFHNQPFDAWGYTYNQVKESLAPVKLKWFLDELKNRKGPQSIYESASGIGLNLYMTLEIIQENTDLSNIYIYSNEYLPKSVQRANNLFEYATPPSGKKGIICPGDSMNLSFVPAHSFDIVYTGYISPDWDPLKLNKSFRKNYDIMAGWCSDITANKTTATTEHSKTLARLMQQFQEKHYYRWVAEMVRIAKPGSPVIIESISYPYCQNTNDWGGVDKNFWKEKLIDSFGLPVQKDSVQYMDLSGLDMKRYHVFMRKLKL